MGVDGNADSGAMRSPPVRSVSPLQRRLVGLALAVLVLIVISTAAVGVRTQRRLSQVEARLGRAEQIELVVEGAADPTTRSARLIAATPGVSLDVVVLGDGTALVWRSRLPDAPPQRSYFLWAVVAGRPMLIGPLDPAGKPQVVNVPASASGLLATEEAATGPPQGTRIVVSGPLSGPA